MREVHRRQFQLGQAPIEKIRIDPKSRDDIPAVLKGLQHVWGDEALRARLSALLDEHILPETDRTVGRPGMDLWRILVLGVLKQGLGCDFDRLHDLTNHHETIRAFLGHGDFGDKTHYEYRVSRKPPVSVHPARRGSVRRAGCSTLEEQRRPAGSVRVGELDRLVCERGCSSDDAARPSSEAIQWALLEGP